MGRMKGRELKRAAYIREFIFDDYNALHKYLKGLRGEWYILMKITVPEGIKVTIVQQYNGAPLWEVKI